MRRWMPRSAKRKGLFGMRHEQSRSGMPYVPFFAEPGRPEGGYSENARLRDILKYAPLSDDLDDYAATFSAEFDSRRDGKAPAESYRDLIFGDKEGSASHMRKHLLWSGISQDDAGSLIAKAKTQSLNSVAYGEGRRNVHSCFAGDLRNPFRMLFASQSQSSL